MAIEAVDDPADLGGLGNDSDDRHSGSTAGAGHHIQLVDLGQQLCRRWGEVRFSSQTRLDSC